MGRQIAANGASHPSSPEPSHGQPLGSGQIGEKNAAKNTSNSTKKKNLNKTMKSPLERTSAQSVQTQSCLVFAFTGSGNVTKGAREMFELLPHEYISPSDLPSLRGQVESGERSAGKVYGVLLTLRDLVQLKSVHRTDTLIPDLSTQDSIDKAHYYAHPEEYESIFHTRIAPYVTVIVNGIYWDSRYPRLLTKSQLFSLREEGNTNLKVVADISCDVGGSFEFLSHTTSIEKPFYTYVSETDRDVDGVHKSGVVMLGEEH